MTKKKIVKITPMTNSAHMQNVINTFQQTVQVPNCSKAYEESMFTKPLIPLFSSNNLSMVSKINTEDCVCSESKRMQLFSGAMQSKCPLPCTTTTTYTMLGNVAYDSVTLIMIFWDENISVMNSTLDRFQPMVALNFLGSNLGLWPGLGIFQLVEFLFDSDFLRKRFKNFIEAIFIGNNWICQRTVLNRSGH
jgi:hypothetical protein